MERYGSLAQVGELVGAAPDSRQVVDRVRRLTTHVKELQKENAVRALLTDARALNTRAASRLSD